MNYTVDIIDTEDDSHTLQLENAEAASIVLTWNGGDAKDDQVIVGSSLDFTLEVHTSTGTDGHFRHLFTGNETRYKIRLYKPADDPEDEETIWTGFLLPDSYQEPYSNGTFYPRFTATDGLGRLRGKYLTDDFYEDEKSVVDIICSILQLTGLQLPVNIAPAIENVLEKDYANIYLNTSLFIEKDRQLDAYNILSQIMGSMLCVVYQADNEWWVEGLNRRHVKIVPFMNYDYEGTYLNFTKKTKLEKDFSPLDEPLITVVPPYAKVTVTHTREQQALPATIAQEANDGWAIGQGVNGDIHPTHWHGNAGFFAKALAPDYKVTLPTRNEAGFNTTAFVNLRNKIYVKKYDKLVFSAKFASPVSAKTDDGTTVNGMRVTFLLNNGVIYSLDRSFEDDEVEMKFDLYITQAGLLDLRILQPYFMGNLEDETYARYIIIDELKLEVIAFNDTMTYANVINDEFTLEKEVPLDIADDAAGFSKAFRLAKLDQLGETFNEIEVPILYGFTQTGRYYSVVSLYGANLISDNIDTVYYDDELLTDLVVTYNHQNGEQMVVETATAITSGNFTVRKYKVLDHTESRAHWEQWTDVVYPIEKDRYIESVGKVYRRLFIAAHERVEFTSDAAFKFNDMVYFNYILPSNYFLTNVSWNLDTGESSGVMVKAVYQNEIIDVGVGNVPPIVDAGEDLYWQFIGFVKSKHTTAEAYDPDGFIASYQWTIEEGDPNAVLTGTDTLQPTIVRFSGNSLTLRLTVTDNDGATAWDTVSFFKRGDTELFLTEDLYFNLGDPTKSGLVYKRDLLSFSPALADGVAITVKGNYWLKHIDPETIDGSLKPGITTFQVMKNGVIIISNVLAGEVVEELGDFEFNYIDGDVIKITVQCYANFVLPSNRNYIDLRSGYEINGVVYQNGTGVVTGYPVTQEVIYEGSPPE